LFSIESPFQVGGDALALGKMEDFVTAASARISRQRASIPATAEELRRAVAWARQWSVEFPYCLSNHLPMVLAALQRMGASAERLEAFCQT